MITVDQLVERVAVLTREVRSSDEPVTQKQWEAFDASLHRFLVGSIGYQGTRVAKEDPFANIFRELVDRYPPLLRSSIADPAIRPEESGRVGCAVAKFCHAQFRGPAVFRRDVNRARPPRSRVASFRT